jgi:cellulose 1,4-beta-cellobiosidase
MKNCTKDNGCQWTDKSVTLDANWRWIHGINGYENCYDGTSWNSKFCPDDVSCAKNCDLEGVPDSDWKDPYGVKSDGLTM